jgi:hypothetical protein
MNNYKKLNNAFSIILIAIIPFAANAQKQPNVQQSSLRTPGDIKIDGKATEWNDQFQAYNHATNLFYTITNDDDDLYLIIQATKPRIIEKILAVGVTLIINKNGETSYKAKENTIVTFPVLSARDAQHILSASGVKTFNATIQTSGRTDAADDKIKQPDSLVTLANKLFVANSNTIKIKGMTGVPDTISIYNEYKIKAAAAFDNNGTYTYELAIPLKLLALSLNNMDKFSYGIQLKSRLDDFKKGNLMVYRYGAAGNQIDANQDLDSTTDFWGEYTLVKK